MQLVDYERYIVDNNFIDVSKSRYYVGWVKKYLSLNLSNQLNIEEKVRQFVQYPIFSTKYPMTKGKKRHYRG